MTERSTCQPPVPPAEPEPWECCGSGCEPCVYDRYWQALERYEEELARWRERAAAAAGTTPARQSTEAPSIDKGGVSP